MSLSSDLKTFLEADSVLFAQVNTRIYPLRLPQVPVLPAITYQFISGFRTFTLDGPDGLSRPRVQFDVFASTYLSMETVFELLRKRLNGFRGTIGTSPQTLILGIFFDNERDFFEFDGDQGSGSGTGIYRRSSDYFINYKEALT